MAEPAPQWLHGDRLRRVWDHVGDALERRALQPRGTLEVAGLSRDERHALSDVVGSPVTGATVRLRLADLDHRFRARTGRGVAEVVTWVTGRVLVDRAAQRRDAIALRQGPFDAAREWLLKELPGSSGSGPGAPVSGPGAPVSGGHAAGAPQASVGLIPAAATGWVDDWLAALRRDGVLTAGSDGTSVLITALRVLEGCGAFGNGPAKAHARTDLAARITGSSHGLDDGSKVALVVLRAAAARSGTRLPRSASERRRLWEALGVVVDRVSATCLVWNITPAPMPAASTPRLAGPGLSGTAAHRTDGGPPAPGAADARVAPRHLTWWDLDSGVAFLKGQRILVCENPRILEAIAERGPTAERIGLVCTMGRANLVVREVLRRLVTSGAVLRYHGDFDWAGVALANSCLAEFGADPWLMGPDDYHGGHGSEPLSGRPIEADWDQELAAAMRARGVAVHEEAVLESLVERLPELWS
ncbi:DUF2399 domain-containing protein [Intrasporangium calvum]|uniref:DUF2399 domain-containing protein n=1 Tax=Intrasporangium calvum TaxID=53358 RepID=UPI000DF5FB98|nr:DUF2399 domain-containing protein [Intrasporangium calvum]AXG13062.1 DUF2399 domain-containing protein [Intrasporangium calvum]